MLHSALTKIHVLENWTYATAAARTGATGFVTADLGKIAYQQDTGQYYRLTAVTPTWVLITGIVGYPAAAGAAGNVLRSDGTNFVSAVLGAADISPVPGYFATRLVAVNFNAANTDNAITIVLPTGYTRYRASALIISHPSVNIGTATYCLFSAPAGGGNALIANPTTAVLTATAENTSGNSQFVATTFNGHLNVGTLYFRTLTAQGVAATADVTLTYIISP